MFSNGDRYFGEISEGHMKGLGVLLRTNREYYLGHFDLREPVGLGMLVKNDQV